MSRDKFKKKKKPSRDKHYAITVGNLPHTLIMVLSFADLGCWFEWVEESKEKF